jgi:outer membrane protein assembly factor BamD
MKQSSMARLVPVRFASRSWFPSLASALACGLAVASLLTAGPGALAQTPVADSGAQTTPADATSATPAPATTTQPQSVNISNLPPAKKSKKVAAQPAPAKTAKKDEPRYKKENPLAGSDANLPDKQLYDKAQDAIKHGHYDVARLDLQTLLNTYQDTQFMMRAKLAIADSWYKEGGTAALTQAEQEYRDFITFFPNQPEAAEAQMRIGDIYFKEMDKPDRDHSKAILAEENYRLMLQQFPESPRIPEAAQRLREVQESLASAEADVAVFYASRLNWAAAIARFQTVADTYPQYSHMDDVLVGLGDSYEAEARAYRGLKMPEEMKAKIVAIFENQAADAYRKVVLEHSAAPHVEDARDRLAAMNLPIPTPTPQQVAASVALENSRGQYTLSKRAELLILHKADTVSAATSGMPPLEDPKATYAPGVLKSFSTSIQAVVTPQANQAPAAVASAAQPSPASPAPQAPAVAPAAAPLEFQDVAPAPGSAAAMSTANSAPAASASIGVGTGTTVQIVQPSANSSANPSDAAPPAGFPGATGPTTTSAVPSASAAAITNTGAIAPVGPVNTALPPIEKAEQAPDPINDVIPGSQPAAQTAAANGKNKKPALDKDDSSSKKKPKKGIAKLNPF